MKIRDITFNNRKREFKVSLHSGAVYPFPYSEADPQPSGADPIRDIFVDKELGNEAFTWRLESGKEGSVHIEQVLEYHEDPEYMTHLMLYKLSVEAQRWIEKSGLSRRQIAARLGTSVPQLHHLLDSSNTNKSMKQLIALLHVLHCNVELIVKKRTAA